MADLKQRFRQFRCLNCDEVIDDVWDKVGDALPTFSDSVLDIPGAWSWDEENALVSDGWDEFKTMKIVLRDEYIETKKP